MNTDMVLFDASSKRICENYDMFMSCERDERVVHIHHDDVVFGDGDGDGKQAMLVVARSE
jgi:hypothetical protein